MSAADLWIDVDPTLCPDCGRESCEDHLPPDRVDERLAVGFAEDELENAVDVARQARAADEQSTPFNGAIAVDFLRSKSGSIVADDLDNIRLALTKSGCDPSVRRLHAASARHGDAPGRRDVRLRCGCASMTLQVPPVKDTFRTVIGVDARNDAFHPVRDYLDALCMGRVPRLDTGSSRTAAPSRPRTCVPSARCR